ncbi:MULTISPECIES: SusC/RagA family TonB-linked outer membrane protein [unclassified Carboxylicivirga]|uniref:SusC/RagA family TonB-linked outer membrane protein n=1 Tax=Carboxylicivirga TaxID=1628153 RepID=UPI003D35856E
MKKITNKPNFLRSLLVSFLLIASNYFVLAQTKSVSGTIKDQNGLPVPGVTIVEVANPNNGTLSGMEGNFTIVVSEGAKLQFSFIGFESVVKEVAGLTTLNITLIESTELLDDVVVTALGISREKKELGYAVSEVKGDEFDKSQDANVMNALSGKVAGMQISPSVGGAGSSSRVIIRGNSTLAGSNQPLYVVDGIPMNNNSVTGSSADYGDGLASINPDDIASMSVLKGPAATALYGTRAINGVVLITTKSGDSFQKNIGVEFSSKATFDQALILPDWQDQYGQGQAGKISTSVDAARRQLMMWGAKYANQTYDATYDGKERIYKFHENYDEFFKTGMTLNNSVAITGGSENTSLRFSYSNLSNEGIIPNTDYSRNTFALRSTSKLYDDKLTLDVKVSYANEQSDNRSVGAIYALYYLPDSYDVKELKSYKDDDGHPIGYDFQNSNPYWDAYEATNSMNKDRVLGMASLKYAFSKQLSLTARAGADLNFYKTVVTRPIGTAGSYSSIGYARQANNKSWENNFDVLASYNTNFGEDFSFNVNAGGNRMQAWSETIINTSENFSDPNLQNPFSGNTRSSNRIITERAINSLYATTQLGYRDFIYVDFSARNDWSSTLPADNNSYFYPSVSSSLIFTEFLNQPAWFSFGKLRASWAKVGSDANPYVLQQYYTIDQFTHSGTPIGSISGNNIPNQDLRPSMSTSYELGFDLKFFNNRVGLDVTYYDQTADDQILNVAIGSSTGYNGALINTGSIRNSGIEVTSYFKPFSNNSFAWTIDLNWARNRNEIIDLYPGLDQLVLASEQGASIQARPGQPYGLIIGKAYQRDEYGNKIVTNSGTPIIADEDEVLGNSVPDWMGGIRNTFQIKNVAISFLIDGRFGNDIFSATEQSSYGMGKNKKTLVGRDIYAAGEKWVPEGLVTHDASGALVPYDANTNPERYYHDIRLIHEENVYDGSFIKLRDASVSWNLPARWFENKFIKSLSVGAFGNNLVYLWRNTDNIDPEAAALGSGSGQGLETYGMPLTRSFGANLNLKF